MSHTVAALSLLSLLAAQPSFATGPRVALNKDAESQPGAAAPGEQPHAERADVLAQQAAGGPPRTEPSKAETGGNDGDEASRQWWWRLQYVQAAGVVVTLVFSIANMALVIGTLRATKRAADAAEKSANAAKQSANAAQRSLFLADRPWVVIEPEGDPEVVETYDTRGSPNTGDGVVTVMVSHFAKNIGKTPAWVTSEAVNCACVLRPIPDELTPPRMESPARLPRVPIAGGARSDGAGEVVHLSRWEQQAILAGDAALLLYGRIEYRDALGLMHETHFSWIYDHPAQPRSIDDPTLCGDTDWNDSPWFVFGGPHGHIRNT